MRRPTASPRCATPSTPDDAGRRGQTRHGGSRQRRATAPSSRRRRTPEEAFALYDQCLQDHGVDPGEGFVVAAAATRSRSRPPAAPTPRTATRSDDQVFVYAQDAERQRSCRAPDDELIAASEACRGHLANATPDFDLTPEQEAAMEDAQLAFQQCMEDHGIEGGGFSISVGGGPGTRGRRAAGRRPGGPALPSDVDPEEFQAAAEECQSVYDDYPELDDVFPDGGPMGGVSVRPHREHRWIVKRKRLVIGAVVVAVVVAGAVAAVQLGGNPLSSDESDCD